MLIVRPLNAPLCCRGYCRLNRPALVMYRLVSEVVEHRRERFGERARSVHSANINWVMNHAPEAVLT